MDSKLFFKRFVLNLLTRALSFFIKKSSLCLAFVCSFSFIFALTATHIFDAKLSFFLLTGAPKANKYIAKEYIKKSKAKIEVKYKKE